MKIECVIVCRDYSDFLEHTLADNLQQLDDVVVVTSPEDADTQRLCAKYSVQCVKTEVFTEYGDTFCKARAINLGLSYLRKEDWLLHLDADIFLCRDFRRMLQKALPDPKNIYGADRMNVYGYESWQRLKPLLDHTWDSRWFADPGFCHKKVETAGIDMRIGARVIHEEHGYVPIGYFQLWHQSAGHRYNHKLGGAAGSDVIFPTQWPRARRVLLPDITVYHLDSETTHGIGTNWKGRKSRRFGPEPRLEHRPHYEHRPHKHHGKP
jgi:hypothetical protein